MSTAKRQLTNPPVQGHREAKDPASRIPTAEHTLHVVRETPAALDVPASKVRGGAGQMTPEQRSLRARTGAYALHAQYDSREITANARQAFLDRFEREVDPEGRLSMGERARRAEYARKAYFSQLAMRSAAARKRRAQGRT